MPKRIANGLTLLSAVVCLGSAMLVGRSVFRADQMGVPIGRSHVCGGYTMDAQMVLWHAGRSGEFFYTSRSTSALRNQLDMFWQDLTGVRLVCIGWGSAATLNLLILPLWLLPLLTAIGPVRWWRRRRRDGGRGFPVAGA